MESLQNSISENIQVFTTEEVIQNQVKNLIHELMDAGKASRRGRRRDWKKRLRKTISVGGAY